MCKYLRIWVRLFLFIFLQSLAIFSILCMQIFAVCLIRCIFKYSSGSATSYSINSAYNTLFRPKKSWCSAAFSNLHSSMQWKFLPLVFQWHIQIFLEKYVHIYRLLSHRTAIQHWFVIFARISLFRNMLIVFITIRYKSRDKTRLAALTFNCKIMEAYIEML